MTTLAERDLQFRFDADWIVVQWDECEFRRRREQHGAAVDFVGFHSDGQLWMFEVKDYPDHPLAVVPEPTDLAALCVRKARDSLAQMLWSAAEVGRPTDKDVETLIRLFGATEHALAFVLWIEDARVHPLDVLVVQAELDAAFRWLPAVVTTLSIGAPTPAGLAVVRT